MMKINSKHFFKYFLKLFTYSDESMLNLYNKFWEILGGKPNLIRDPTSQECEEPPLLRVKLYRYFFFIII